MREEDRHFFERMALINFEPLLARVIQSNETWTRQRATSALRWYKRFLFLAYKYPNRRLAVLKDVDELWHLHILNTRQYFSDCEGLFGRYLHHTPLSDTEGTSSDLLEETSQLYAKHFGKRPDGSSKIARCGGNCSKCSNDFEIAA
ncbi:MAG TPA: hypothetical protein VN838_26415 [Bradyrhizobium sp.]|nr:hypothetical protein [Bradyrhizobium sp.]